jgi:phosphonate transport system substrate-binding protein
VDPESNSGSLYPTYRLTKLGETADSFFHNYVYTYGHDKSIRAVLEGLVDGAAIEGLIFEYMAVSDPAIASQLKVIDKSPPFAIPPVVVHPALDLHIKEELRNVLLNMDEDEKGREILRKMNFDKFVILDDSAYDSIREMYHLVQSAIAGQ